MAREVGEEAGIRLASIHLLGSQPWPIGGAGCLLHCCAAGNVEHPQSTVLLLWADWSQCVQAAQAAVSS